MSNWYKIVFFLKEVELTLNGTRPLEREEPLAEEILYRSLLSLTIVYLFEGENFRETVCFLNNVPLMPSFLHMPLISWNISGKGVLQYFSFSLSLKVARDNKVDKFSVTLSSL